MPEYKTIAQVGDIDPGEALVTDFGRMWVILFNINGEYHAIEDRCSHADVELSGGEIDLQACQIKCPKHGAKFDIKTGEVLAAPAVVPIMTFDVRIEGDDIQIARRVYGKS